MGCCPRRPPDDDLWDDEQTVSEVLRTLQPKIVRYCRAHIGRDQRAYASADDVAQDALLGIVRALPNYRGTLEAFNAFAFSIARHKVADFHRASYRDQSVLVEQFPEPPDTAARPDEQIAQAVARAEIKALLDTLNTKQREVLVLRLIVGLSTTETAQAMSCTPGSVRVRQHRALTNLRRRLGLAPRSPTDS